MITGFNTDIEYEGVVYHVQTEDKGLSSPLILSLVYSGGRILASKRSPYKDLIAAGYDEEVLSERLKLQHRLICAAINAGRLEELKGMGSRNKVEDEIEDGPASTVSATPETSDEFILETAAERPIIETAAERPPMAAEPPVAHLPDEDEVQPRFQERSQAEESAYTVYDPRRKSPMGAPVQSESGLVLTILNEREYHSAETFAIRILLENRSGKKEKPVAGVTLSLRILGTTFRPQIFSVKTGRDGVGVVSGRIPYFDSGRAAIVIRAVVDGNAAELRRVIHPAD